MHIIQCYRKFSLSSEGATNLSPVICPALLEPRYADGNTWPASLAAAEGAGRRAAACEVAWGESFALWRSRGELNHQITSLGYFECSERVGWSVYVKHGKTNKQTDAAQAAESLQQSKAPACGPETEVHRGGGIGGLVAAGSQSRETEGLRDARVRRRVGNPHMTVRTKGPLTCWSLTALVGFPCILTLYSCIHFLGLPR